MAMPVEYLSEDLSACRICLATNIKLYSISDGLEDNFVELMGVEFSDTDGLPQYLCPQCRMQLLRAADLRARCRRSEQLLKHAQNTQSFLTTDDILKIDRNIHRLALNLTQLRVYNFDSRKKKETVIVKDPHNEVNSFDHIEELPEIQRKIIDPVLSKVIIEPKAIVGGKMIGPKVLVKNEEPEKPEVKSNLLFEIDGLNMARIKVKTVDAKEEKLKNMRIQFKKQKEKEAKKMDVKAKHISNLMLLK